MSFAGAINVVRRRHSFSDRQEFIAKAKTARLRGSLVNTNAVDIFLLYGSPNPGAVQRIGAWLFGLLFCTLGAVFIGYAREERSVFLGLFGLGWVLLGLRVFRNGFKRREPGKPRLNE
jgi:hypothetical protein